MEANSSAQAPAAVPGRAAARARMLPGWRSFAWVVGVAVATAVALIPLTRNTYIELLGETLFVGLLLMFAFHAAGGWRQTWMPPWAAQVIAVVIAAALAPLIVQLVTTRGDVSYFLGSRSHVRGYIMVTIGGALIGIALGLGALLRERDAQARTEALNFALMRETLERQAADARLHLLTAQIQPHFLLNTLANVQELVESGSPRAVPVFRSLIAYLRAAMPHLQRDESTLGEEERLVAAYLDLMQMRMPDRLGYRVTIAPELRGMRFPQMALLTLVENAIHHGIDPGVERGEVEVGARREGDRIVLWVADTGVGMSETAGDGTGLRNLKARLHATFGPEARIELSEVAPHGVRAEIRLQASAAS